MFSSNRHFSVVMYSSSVIGIWPFVFENDPKLKKIYAFYSKTVLAYYFFFIGTLFTKLVLLLTDENGIELGLLSANLTVTLIDTVTFFRQALTRRKAVRELLGDMLKTEEEIYKTDDVEIRKIYEACANETAFVSKLCLCFMNVLSVIYVLTPLALDDYVVEVNNKTYDVKPLPLPSWVPFNEQEYYAVTYCWQGLFIVIAIWYLFFTDLLMYALITYQVGQLRIMRYMLLNIDTYSLALQEQKRIDENDADVEILKQIFSTHRQVIHAIDTFNDVMSNLMLVDFLQCSLQLASVIMQVAGVKKISAIFVLYVISTAGAMFIRLILYYYNGNEIIFQSQLLGDSLWQTRWYDKSPKVKYMMYMFLIRTKKALSLNLGPFGTMSIQSFLTILKTTYSYLMLMRGLK